MFNIYKYYKYYINYKKINLNNYIINGGIINNNKIKTPDNVYDIFPKYKNVDLTKIKFTKESIYSVSKNNGALFTIKKIIKHYGSSDLIITDCTANIGSDTINFGLYFTNVNAIECDKINYKALKYNIKLYNLQNIKTIYGDINNVINTLKQDIIYIDAPWGGLNYKKYDNIKLYLNTYEISNFIINNINKAKIFVLKVPYNYDYNYLLKNINKYNIFIYPYIINDKIKYFIIIIHIN
jgi:hypothetical protein